MRLNRLLISKNAYLCPYIFSFLIGISLSSSADEWEIATDQHFPPYVYQDQSGIKGIHLDIIKAVMAQLNEPYSIKAYPWARVITKINKADIDFAFPFVGTPKRFGQYILVGPLQDGRTVFASSITSQIEYDKLEDLIGLTIGVVRGYAYTGEFDNADFLIKDMEAKDNINNIKKLVAGRIDLIIGDENVLAVEAKKLNLLNKLKFLPKALKEVKRYAAFPKSKQDKADRFSAALNVLKSNGTYQFIIDKHVSH